MTIKDWTTHFPTTQDVLVTDQPDLVNYEDDARVTQIHTLRDKLDSVARYVGDIGNVPSGSLRERVDILEFASADRILVFSDDVAATESGAVFVPKKSFRFVIDPDKKVHQWRVLVGLWTDGTGETAECQFVVTGVGSEQLAVALTSTATSEEIRTGELDVSPTVEPEGTLITLEVQLRAVGGSAPIAHLQFCNVYGVMHG